MKSMKVDFVAKTITITAECAERMNDPNSTEYKAIRQLCADFPSMKIVKRTHRTPRKYVSKSTGEKFNCNQFKNLTYENMETFISGLPNAEQYMTAFNFLKDCGSLPPDLPLYRRPPLVRRSVPRVPQKPAGGRIPERRAGFLQDDSGDQRKNRGGSEL